MRSELLWNEKGFLHPFLLFLTAFFLLLLTSGSMLMANKVQSTDLLFEQYKVEQAASITFRTFEKYYLPHLDEEDTTFQIHNKAAKADITVTWGTEEILVQYVVATDFTVKPITFYKTYPSDE